MFIRLPLTLAFCLTALPVLADSHSVTSAADEAAVTGNASAGTASDGSISLDGIKEFKGLNHAIKPEDLEIEDGAVLALLGTSGTGKTVTMHAILRPTSGYLGFDVGGGRNEVLYDINVASVFAAGPDDTAFKRVADDALRRAINRLGELDKAENDASELAALQKIIDDFEDGIAPLPEDLRKQTRATFYQVHGVPLPADGGRVERLAELSGGQKQRVSIGRAVMSRARVLIADEPTPGLEFGPHVEELREKNGLKQFLIQIDGQTRFRILAVNPINFPNGLAIWNSLELFNVMSLGQSGSMLPEHTLAGIIVATDHIPVVIEDLDTGTRVEIPQNSTAVANIVASLPDASQGDYQAYFPFMR